MDSEELSIESAVKQLAQMKKHVMMHMAMMNRFRLKKRRGNWEVRVGKEVVGILPGFWVDILVRMDNGDGETFVAKRGSMGMGWN